jgi:cell division protein FtsL
MDTELPTKEQSRAMDLVIRILDLVRSAGVDVSLWGEVVVCVVPQSAVVHSGLQILAENAAVVRERLHQEAEWFERELAADS